MLFSLLRVQSAGQLFLRGWYVCCAVCGKLPMLALPMVYAAMMETAEYPSSIGSFMTVHTYLLVQHNCHAFQIFDVKPCILWTVKDRATVYLHQKHPTESDI